MSVHHVYPLNDLKPHDTESIYCDCNPMIDWTNRLVIHHAWDHREAVEEAEALLQNAED